MNAIFKAVVWKELRANLKWGVVILLGMLVMLIYRMQIFASAASSGAVNTVIDNLEGVAAFGAILAGLLIGTAQAVVESRGDKWGFLAHRPASLSTLFWGKVTAGMLLCAISTGVPIAIALTRVAIPGFLPVPFDWRIALPVIANLFGGLVCYFAGFLTGMRQARWYASRALGIASAFGCIGWQAASATTFGQAAAISVLGLVVVGTAAWGTFVAGGQYGAQPRIGRVATGLVIGLGMVLVGYAALMVSFWTFKTPQLAAVRASFYTVTGDGHVVRVTTGPLRTLEVTDTAGRPLEQYLNTPPGQPPGSGVLTARLSPRPVPPPSLQATSWLYIPLGTSPYGDPVSWYYVRSLGLISAFDNRTRQHLGWMGPDGFSPGDAKPRPFAGPLNRMIGHRDPRILAFEDAVYRMDPERRNIVKIFQAESSEKILDAGSSQMGALQTSTPALDHFDKIDYFQVFATTRRLIVQRLDGTRLLELPQDSHKALQYSSLQVSRAMRAQEVSTFLWYQNSSNGESVITQYTGAGVVVNSWTLPPTSAVPEASISQTIIQSAVSPLIGMAAFEMADRMKAAAPSGLKSDKTLRWIIAALSALGAAVAVFLHGRSYAFTTGRLAAWTAVALLLGVSGYLLLLVLVELPARETCAACSRKRVVTRQHCEHCSAPFAAPQRDGTEIFEPVTG